MPRKGEKLMSRSGGAGAAENSANTANSQGKLTHEEFFNRAIDRFPKAKSKNGDMVSKGIHSVYSKIGGANVNETFRSYYGTDPIEAQKALVKAGKLQTRPAFGGAILYHVGDKPQGFGPKDTKEAIDALTS
jgi:hypothetical protein